MWTKNVGLLRYVCEAGLSSTSSFGFLWPLHGCKLIFLSNLVAINLVCQIWQYFSISTLINKVSGTTFTIFIHVKNWLKQCYLHTGNLCLPLGTVRRCHKLQHVKSRKLVIPTWASIGMYFFPTPILAQKGPTNPKRRS